MVTIDSYYLDFSQKMNAERNCPIKQSFQKPLAHIHDSPLLTYTTTPYLSLLDREAAR